VDAAGGVFRGGATDAIADVIATHGLFTEKAAPPLTNPGSAQPASLLSLLDVPFDAANTRLQPFTASRPLFRQIHAAIRAYVDGGYRWAAVHGCWMHGVTCA
jgi:hypothetical protein